MTNGAGLSTAVSAGQTRTPSSTPVVDLKMWSLKPDSAARGMEAIMGLVNLFSYYRLPSQVRRVLMGIRQKFAEVLE